MVVRTLPYAILLLFTGTAIAAEPVGYYDHIKPLLSVHCYKCHSGETAKVGLRLDLRDNVLAKHKSGRLAIVPGDAGASEVVRRITSRDPEEMMPPKGERLSAAEVERVRAWVEQGARWPDKDDYWAFQPPEAPTVPPPVAASASINPIDRFIEARLE